MRKYLTVLTALALLLTGICMTAVQAEESSFLGSMMAVSGTQSQITPEQEQELTTIVQYLTQDLTEETALEILSWDKDTILRKLEGYETPLEHFASKEEVAELLAGMIGQIAPLFQMSEEQMMDQAGNMMGMMAGMMDFSSSEEEDPYADVAIDGIFNSTYWESGDLKLTSVWQDGYYKILIQDGEKEWIYLCEEDHDTGWKKGIGCGDPDQTEIQEDHGIATFYTRWENNRDEMIWEKADGSQTVFTRIIDPLDETQWYREGMMLTLTWRGDNTYDLHIDGYGLQDYTAWDYFCVLDEDRDALTGTGKKATFMGDIYTDAQAVFAFSEGRTVLTWTDDQEETAKEGLAFEGVDKVLTTKVWELPEKYALSGAFAAGYYVMTVIEIGMDPTIEHTYLCTYDRTASMLTAVNPEEVDLEPIINQAWLDQSVLAGNASFEILDDETLVWKEATGITGDEGIVLTINP